MAFLALLPVLQAQLAEGWTARVVYDRHCDKLKFSYSQFNRYVRRYISGKDETKKSQDSPAPNTAKPVAERTERQNVGSLPVGQPGFNYSPKTNKDELI